jgi:hypothetical protein
MAAAAPTSDPRWGSEPSIARPFKTPALSGRCADDRIHLCRCVPDSSQRLTGSLTEIRNRHARRRTPRSAGRRLAVGPAARGAGRATRSGSDSGPAASTLSGDTAATERGAQARAGEAGHRAGQQVGEADDVGAEVVGVARARTRSCSTAHRVTPATRSATDRPGWCWSARRGLARLGPGRPPVNPNSPLTTGRPRSA